MKVFVSILLCYCFSALTAQSLSSNQNSALLFCSYLQQNKLDSAYDFFDPKAKNQMSKSLFEGTWNPIIQKLGILERYSLSLQNDEMNPSVIIIYCEFSQNKIDMKIPFSEANKILGFAFLPHKKKEQVYYSTPNYDNPKKYTEENTSIKGEITLPAILTIPKNQKQFPIAILIHGSGPNDKDETFGPNKIFKDIAIGLAINGIASIRYDKRTFISKSMDTVTIEKEVMNDVVSAIKYIETNEELKGRKIYLIGHSLGAILAPSIGLDNSSVSGVICMAASPRSMEMVMLDQVTYLARIDSTISSSEKDQIRHLTGQIDYLQDSLSIESPSSELPMGIPASYWHSLKRYNFEKAIQTIQKPLFIIQGERDYQVTMSDFDAIKNIVLINPYATLKSYPKLNHMFLEGNRPSVPDEYYIPSNIPYYLIHDLSEWIKQ